MSLDTTLLRLLKSREQYERLHRAVPKEGIDQKTLAILRDIGAYYRDNPGVTDLDPDAFRTYFVLRHPKLGKDALAVYLAQIETLHQDAPPGTETGIRERLVSTATAASMLSLVEQFESGEADLTAGLRKIAQRHEEWLGAATGLPKVRDRIEDILVADENETGLHWRIDSVNAAMRPLRPGDTLAICARVDAGKTSFLSSELTFFAPQVDALWPGENRNVLVLNNEGPGSRLKRRLYNSALGMTTEELVTASRVGNLYDQYVKALGGRDCIRVYDIHDYRMSQLEDIVRTQNAGVVVVDMLDNVTMDGGATNGGERTDQLLEAMYQRARIWAVKYQCIVIATSQLNGDAEGVMWPTLAMMANSKTGKAGAMDAVLMLGRSHAEGMDSTRFVSLPKNKLHRDGGSFNLQRQVYFDRARGLLVDP